MDTPLTLQIDETKHIAKVGERQIHLQKSMSPHEYNLLIYLYHHNNQIVSKEELYFLAYLKLNRIPNDNDSDYEPGSTYIGLVDTMIWRIRSEIETNVANPLLLISVKGKGFKLVNCLE